MWIGTESIRSSSRDISSRKAATRRGENALQAVAPYRRAQASGPRERLPHRRAVPFCAGDTACGRQARPSRPYGQGGRPMASFPFCGPRRFRLGRVTALASDPNAPVKRYTPPGAEVDSVIDLRAVFQQGHRALKREVPRRAGTISAATKSCAYLKDGRNIFSMRVVDRDRALHHDRTPRSVYCGRPPARRSGRACGLLRPHPAADGLRRTSTFAAQARLRFGAREREVRGPAFDRAS
jgi:hypothetical protein